MKLVDLISEKKKGLWANINAKRKRGEKPARKGSKAFKKAKAAADKLNRETVLYRSEQLGLEIVEHSEPVIFQEAEYQGRKVELNKVKRGGDGGKFYVYTKNPKGNVVKVQFGAKGMAIKTKDPDRRRSFRARMGCDKNPGPKHKANYWSCRMWSGPDAVKNMLKK